MGVQKVLEIARGELGYTESPPGSNRTKYWQEYGEDFQGQPWCVSGLWWVFHHADEAMAFFAGAKTASCGTLFHWYQAQGMLVPVDEAKPGDLVFLAFRQIYQPEHLGIVESVTRIPTLQVTTIEFNTTPGSEGSQDNGGCVARKVRYPGQIVGVARPEYKEAEPVEKTDYSKHWAREDIEWAVERGLLKGYPDGTFRPDQPVTRAELAAILRRLEDGDDP